MCNWSYQELKLKASVCQERDQNDFWVGHLPYKEKLKVPGALQSRKVPEEGHDWRCNPNQFRSDNLPVSQWWGGEAGECLYTGLTVPGMVQKCLMALCKRQMLFSLTHNTRTRMTSTKTVLGEFRQKKFFAWHVISLWNSLLQDVVMASNLDASEGIGLISGGKDHQELPCAMPLF